MTDTKKLRDKIKESGLKYSYIAACIGLSPYGFKKKIENDSEFKASEIQGLFELLKLTCSERDQIFFA